MAKDFIKISPIGGVGQIGSNCTLVQTPEENIIIDCGILFPYEDFFSINYLIPDLTHLNFEIDRLIITHGHEDHIGAVHHFTELFPNATIHAPGFAKKLIENKFNYRKISKRIEPLESITFGNTTIEPIHVNHSIPDTKGLVLKNDNLDCAVLFISDFKLDLNSPYERPFDFEAVKDLTKYSRRISFLDSTNIMSGNLETPGEGSLISPLKEMISNCSGDVYLTTFSSNIHRIQTVLNIAKDLNRFVIPYGKSVNRYIESALETGFLSGEEVIKDVDDTSIKRQKIVILSGCQGDHFGTTRRVITKNDTRLKLKENDLVIFSSKPIPGNEKKVAMLYNEVVEQDCELICANDKVHVSGHPGKEDLRKVYEAFKPTHAIPIHGESLFLKEHCKFIDQNNLADTSINIKNGDSIIIKDDIKVSNIEINEPIIIHGSDLVLERPAISERRKLATSGLVVVSIPAADVQKYRATCTVTLNGLPQVAHDHYDEFCEYISDVFSQNKKKTNDKKIEAMRIATRRFFGERLGYRPIAIVHVC